MLQNLQSRSKSDVLQGGLPRQIARVSGLGSVSFEEVISEALPSLPDSGCRSWFFHPFGNLFFIFLRVHWYVRTLYERSQVGRTRSTVLKRKCVKQPSDNGRDCILVGTDPRQPSTDPSATVCPRHVFTWTRDEWWRLRTTTR